MEKEYNNGQFEVVDEEVVDLEILRKELHQIIQEEYHNNEVCDNTNCGE